MTTSQQILNAVQSELNGIQSGSLTYIPYAASQSIASMLVAYASTQSGTYAQSLTSLASQAPKCMDPSADASCGSEHTRWLLTVQAALQNPPSIFANMDWGSWLAVGGIAVGVIAAIAHSGGKKRKAG